MNSAILVFAYKRPQHLKKTLDALAQNFLASTLPCRIYIDGAKTDDETKAVSDVITIAENACGFRSINVTTRNQNIGLYASLTSGISEAFEQYESVLVFEDDILTSPYAIKFLLDGLNLYSNENRVASIHAYTPPISNKLPETFFLRGADCWGWATWHKQWECYRHDANKMATEMEERDLIKLFDLNGNYPYYKMLCDKAKGKNNSWAICWHASCFLAEKLTLYPGRSLVKNIGLDDSGEHCGPSEMMNSSICVSPIAVNPIKIIIDPATLKAYSNHFRMNIPKFLYSKIKLASKNTGIVSSLYKLIRPSKLTLEGEFDTFQEASNACTGYSDLLILDKVTAAINAILKKEGLYERDGTIFQSVPKNLPIRKHLPSIVNSGDYIIDFGGGLAGTYINNRDILPANIHYMVVEQTNFVIRGREIAKQYGLPIHFEETLYPALQTPKVALLSSVLQYLPDPYKVIRQIVDLSPKYILIDRTPLSTAPIWRLQDNGNYYDTSVRYPHRAIVYSELLQIMRGYSLVQKWTNDFDPKIPKHHGFLFMRK